MIRKRMVGIEPIKEYIVNNKIDLDSDAFGVDLVEYITEGPTF